MTYFPEVLDVLRGETGLWNFPGEEPVCGMLSVHNKNWSVLLFGAVAVFKCLVELCKVILCTCIMAALSIFVCLFIIS